MKNYAGQDEVPPGTLISVPPKLTEENSQKDVKTQYVNFVCAEFLPVYLIFRGRLVELWFSLDKKQKMLADNVS